MPVNDCPPEQGLTAGIPIPESPKAPMEFLSRTWSVSALEVPKACSSEPEELSVSLNQFSFTSSATSQFVLDRIMSQTEISPLTSGRLSHSSGPLIGAGGCLAEDSSPVSPLEEFEDVVKYLRSHTTLQPLFTGGSRLAGGGNNGCNTPGGARGKTVGRWLKERKEKKKEETRAHNAQLHAAVSVAAVASAIAAIAAGTAASSSLSPEKKEQSARTDMALASAATLVAAQCVEAAEAKGAERGHLAAMVSSAVNVRSYDDIATLTAAAATALRGAATLKARELKEVWNAASIIPLERGFNGQNEKQHPKNIPSCKRANSSVPGHEDLIGVFNEELLSRGAELLKRTRQGDLHWKVVSVYIHRTGQVMLKMKSKHVAGTITKKKKNIVLEVCKNMPAWPGRHLIDDAEQRRYFGLRTENRGVVEFECRNRREYDMWTQGVSRLLFIVAARNNKRLI